MAKKARFVARYGNYSVGVQSAVREHFGTGESRVLKQRIDANFINHHVTDDDLAVAVASFSFPGLPEDTDTNEHVSPRWRCSVWDSEYSQQTEGWTDEEIEMIVAKLRSSSGNGVDHIEVTPVAAKTPFPNYDELSIEEILQLAKIAGFDLKAIAAYERENQNREALLKRLEGVEADDDAVVVNAG